MRCGVELLPEWSRNDHIRRTLNRRITMAKTRILMSVFPSFQLVLIQGKKCWSFEIEQANNQLGNHISIQPDVFEKAL